MSVKVEVKTRIGIGPNDHSRSQSLQFRVPKSSHVHIFGMPEEDGLPRGKMLTPHRKDPGLGIKPTTLLAVRQTTVDAVLPTDLHRQ